MGDAGVWGASTRATLEREGLRGHKGQGEGCGSTPKTLKSASSLTTGQIPACPSWVGGHQVWVLGKGQRAAPLSGNNRSHTNGVSAELLPSTTRNASFQRGGPQPEARPGSAWSPSCNQNWFCTPLACTKGDRLGPHLPVTPAHRPRSPTRAEAPSPASALGDAPQPPLCPASSPSHHRLFCSIFCVLENTPRPASCPLPSLPVLIPSIIHSTKWIFNLRNEMTLPSGRGGGEGAGEGRSL